MLIFCGKFAKNFLLKKGPNLLRISIMSSIKFQRLERKDWPRKVKAIKVKEDGLLFKIIYTEESYLKVGFVISKKAAKKAVLRNKIKRRLREILREESKKFKRGGKILVFVLPGINENFFTLRKNVQQLLLKTKFYEPIEPDL